jgi:hypothetical protein
MAFSCDPESFVLSTRRTYMSLTKQRLPRKLSGVSRLNQYPGCLAQKYRQLINSFNSSTCKDRSSTSAKDLADNCSVLLLKYLHQSSSMVVVCNKNTSKIQLIT